MKKAIVWLVLMSLLLCSCQSDSGDIHNNTVEKDDTEVIVVGNDFWVTFYDEDSNHITHTVSTYYIAGNGQNMATMLDLDGDSWSVETEEQVGDGMVPIWSASLADKYAERTFYVNGIGHTDLIQENSANVLSFINNLIDGKTSVENFTKIEEAM